MSLRRIGHKGADLLVPGNTIESFRVAAEHGVDMIEFDVLGSGTEVVVAHDSHDAASRRPHTLDEALAAFSAAPLERVEIDLDMKLPGCEREVVEALRRHGLVDRAMVSGMYLESHERVRRLEPALRVGWTYPLARRDWTRRRWAAPGLLVALRVMRRRFPALCERTLARVGLDAVWVYHPLLSGRLATAVEEAGAELVAWTIDDVETMRRARELGVSGICTNDPRLFAELGP